MKTRKTGVAHGALALMVLRTLQSRGPRHGYGLARRIEQTSGVRLAVNYGALNPALMKLAQEDDITSEPGVSDDNRRAKYYRLTRAGRKLEREARRWSETRAIVGKLLADSEAGS